MNYEEALEFTHTFLKFGIKPGLSRIEKLLSVLSNPHSNLKFIHIAGTNGKGSTAAMCASILQIAGYKTGLYISPYVVDFRERMQINGEMIDKSEFADIISKIKTKIETENFNELPTEFELITAAAMLYFAKNKCDIVVLETGMGGRFDATNIIEKPIVSVITAISLDHMAVLGESCEKIAYEKAGIIKENCPVVSYPFQPDGVMEILRLEAERKNAQFITPDTVNLEIKSQTSDNTKIYYRWENYVIPLLGTHQIYNAITAIETVKACGFTVRQAHIFKGILNTHFAGRMEKLSDSPLFYIDGAHNRAGIDTLKNTIKRYFYNKKIIAIMGIFKDKEYRYGIEEIAEISDVFYAVSSQNERSLPAEEITDIAKSGMKNKSDIEIIAFENVFVAIEAAKFKAIEIGDDESVIICTGSLHLIAEIRKLFRI